MKARIRATGDTYNVIDMNDYRNRIQLEDHNWYTMGEIELIEGNEPDWQHYRIQAAIANQQAILSNYDYFSQGIRVECNEHEKKRTQVIAEMAVELADALIAELQEKGGQDDSNND